MTAPRRLVPIVVFVASACATARNYPDPQGPRFAADYAGQPPPAVLRVVTFNVKWGRNVPAALALLRGDPRLQDADIVALQEMDEAGVDRLARSLSLNYVYYPAVVHPADHRNFGNAILSPWPLTDDEKLILPHRNRFRKMQRIAVAATVHVRGRLAVRAFSVHFETPAGLGAGGRRDQARAVIESASRHERVVVAGDFNDRDLAEDPFAAAGFFWPTRDVGRTFYRISSWDHVVARGLRPRTAFPAGAARNALKASDHLPVWAEFELPEGVLP